MGVAHAGALKAAEEEGYVFRGVAGASAGALVATLVAIGYRSDDLIDPASPSSNILTNYAADPITVFGHKKWRTFRKASAQSNIYAFLMLNFGRHVGRIVPSSHTVQKSIIENFYYIDISSLRERINYIIRVKLASNLGVPNDDESLPDWVCFRDIDPLDHNWAAFLKIVATDVINRRPVVFGHHTPDVVIADAVLASISIPFVFSPVDVQEANKQHSSQQHSYDSSSRCFLDGGLVGNLPAWVFSDEKRYIERQIQDRVPLLAFELDGGESKFTPTRRSDRSYMTECVKSFFLNRPSVRNIAAFSHFCTEVGKAGIFGNQRITDELLSDLYVVSLSPSIAPFDLDMSAEKASEAYREGYSRARETFDFDCHMKGQLTRFLHELRVALENRSSEIRASDDTLQPVTLRAMFIQPVGSGRFSFKIVASSGLASSDPDDALMIDSRNAGAPAAFHKRKAVYLNVSRNSRRSLYMTKYEMAMVSPNLQSIIALPVWSPTGTAAGTSTGMKPLGVVSIDSSEDLWREYIDRVFMRLFGAYAMVFSSILSEALGGGGNGH
ncbi:Patatin-like phospholipase [Limimonas halophila]|uniref:Patatin-like phospholipase n=2 Tax=Limimonas halophila TaxID=1082479 RepID=A0A1G7STB5_9PROT|nr:Patatin-like phospholipase [Limimonas halophila]